MEEIMQGVKNKLKQAKLEGDPQLWMQFEPDH
jgi:hypothetical protein